MKFFQCAAAVSALMFASSASAIVFDFEGFPAGTIIDDELTAQGITVSAVNVAGGPNVAVIFDSNNPTGGDTDLQAPFDPGPGNNLGQISPGNLLILQENDTCDANTCTDPDDQAARPSGTITFTFAGERIVESLDFFDIEGPPAEIGDVVLYGAGGNVLATFTIPDTGGDRQWQRLVMNVGGVVSMDVNFGGSGAIDNLTIVPVPAALPLMLAALGALGFARRR